MINKYLVMCYEKGQNPFPIVEKIIRTKKNKHQVYLEYKEKYNVVQVIKV